MSHERNAGLVSYITKGFRFSGRLLYRSYFALVVCIIAIGSMLDYLASRADDSVRLDIFKQHFQPLFAVLIEQLVDADYDQRPLMLAQLSRTTQRELQLYSFADFSADEDTVRQLSAGGLLALFDSQDGLTLYQRIADSDQILGITAPAWNAVPQHNNWVLPVFYILVAIAVFVLILPFSRQLLKLKSAAADFGRGDFSTRIDLPSGSTLAPIVDTFNGMAKRIEQLVLSQRDLTHSVSHELRTPLARLRFAFEEIQAGTADPAILSQLTEMRRDVSELENLVDEMLRYAEINQLQKLHKAPVLLLPLLDKLIDGVQPARIDIAVSRDGSVATDATLDCNEHHLQRALANVLRNAIRFAQSRCEIYLAVSGDDVLIDIADDGPGLTPTQAVRVFEPFYTATRSDQSGSGYGLGLCIAHSIARKHGGSLMVVDGRLGGACFRFTLPLWKLKPGA